MIASTGRVHADSDIANLDVLRTLAVCLVFIEHAAEMLRLRLFGNLVEQITSRIVRSISKHVAKYSYGIYVSHVPMLWLSCVVLFPHSVCLGVALALLSTGLVSAGLFYVLENPAIQLGKRLTATYRKKNVAVA